MCEYSLEAYKSRSAEIGDRLVSGYPFSHGMMRPEDHAATTKKMQTNRGLTLEDVCLTCLKPGTTVNATFRGTTHLGIEFTTMHHHDYLLIPMDGHTMQLAMSSFAAGQGELVVMSIPGVAPKTLDQKLGVEDMDKKVEALVTQAPDPVAVRASYEVATAHNFASTTFADAVKAVRDLVTAR